MSAARWLWSALRSRALVADMTHGLYLTLCVVFGMRMWQRNRYAVMGMSLFGGADSSEFLNEHANFQNFGRAFMLLVRICTGGCRADMRLARVLANRA